MRTKTMLLSALLGTLGSVSLMAQSTNVYSLNAVGYINVTATPGFSMIACPLVCSPDNTLGTILNNGANQYKHVQIFQWNGSSYTNDVAVLAPALANGFTNGWENGGFIAINPGQGAWFYNPNTTNMTLTFVGTVPQGLLTNTLSPGFNMVSSIVPTSGDLVTNPITAFTVMAKQDNIYYWDNIHDQYVNYSYTIANGWSQTAPGQDPIITNVGDAFWYLVHSATTPDVWVENFSVNP